MRIVIDVMGGDHGCGVVIEGVKQALHSGLNLSAVFLVGDEKQIRDALIQSACKDSRIEVIHASEVLSMEDKPVVALRKKKDSSIARSVELLKDGKAEAMISPGNTGGVVACSHIRLRCLPGVERPAIATVMPAPDNEFVLIDAGANVECRPIHLAQYAIMGHIYSRDVLGYAKPRVGILSVGTEDVKGNDLTLEAFKLCKKLDLNFIGNVEGHDLFANRVDVVVCDGFVGNVVLKTCESLAKALFKWLKGELIKTPIRKAGAYMAKGAFLAIKERTDADAYGGAPLLGLNGNVTIAHGSAGPKAIKNAIKHTCDAVQHHINANITREVAKAAEAMNLGEAPMVESPGA
jgi:glycerol-3-phosphate acyltransferase PlsX